MAAPVLKAAEALRQSSEPTRQRELLYVHSFATLPPLSLADFVLEALKRNAVEALRQSSQPTRQTELQYLFLSATLLLLSLAEPYLKAQERNAVEAPSLRDRASTS